MFVQLSSYIFVLYYLHIYRFRNLHQHLLKQSLESSSVVLPRYSYICLGLGRSWSLIGWVSHLGVRDKEVWLLLNSDAGSYSKVLPKSHVSQSCCFLS